MYSAIKRCCFLLLFIIINLKGFNQQVFKQTVRSSELGCIVWLPPNYNPAIAYPLIIFEHGVGQKTDIPPTQTLDNMYDDGLPKVLKNGFIPSYNFIMIAPQDSIYSVSPNIIKYIIHEAKLRWLIDSTRIHLVGFSGGGGGSQGLLTSGDTATARQIASIVSVAGICYPPRVKNDTTSLGLIRLSKVPLMGIIGDSDNTIGYPNEVNFYNGLNNALPGIATLYTAHGVGHTDNPGGANFGYFNGDSAAYGGPDIYTWLKNHPLGSYQPAPPPVVIAATATSSVSAITLPIDTLTLYGGGSSNKGPILTYQWVKQSGPVGDSIVSPASAITKVKKLDVAGTYSYQLKVTDSLGNMATAGTTITVNIAGGSQILIQAELFTGGVNHTSTQSGGTGTIVGIIAPGQLDFSSSVLVNIPSTGTYTFKAHYAGPNSGGTIQLKNASGVILGSAAVIPTSGWSSYGDVSFTVNLNSGLQKLSVAATGQGFNLDYFILQ